MRRMLRDYADFIDAARRNSAATSRVAIGQFTRRYSKLNILAPRRTFLTAYAIEIKFSKIRSILISPPPRQLSLFTVAMPRDAPRMPLSLRVPRDDFRDELRDDFRCHDDDDARATTLDAIRETAAVHHVPCGAELSRYR